MTDLRKAAEMALERLESHDYWADEEAIQALRQALAQPEQEWDSRHPKAQALLRERARLQIELGLVEQLVDDPHFETTPTFDMEYWGPLHDKLKEALTQEEKPPVKSYCGGRANYCTPAPPKPEYVTEIVAVHENGTRTVKQTQIQKRDSSSWVGLTDEEIYDYADKFLYQHGSNYGIRSFGKAIEAKLKERNARQQE